MLHQKIKQGPFNVITCGKANFSNNKQMKTLNKQSLWVPGCKKMSNGLLKIQKYHPIDNINCDYNQRTPMCIKIIDKNILTWFFDIFNFGFFSLHISINPANGLKVKPFKLAEHKKQRQEEKEEDEKKTEK